MGEIITFSEWENVDVVYELNCRKKWFKNLNDIEIKKITITKDVSFKFGCGISDAVFKCNIELTNLKFINILIAKDESLDNLTKHLSFYIETHPDVGN